MIIYAIVLGAWLVVIAAATLMIRQDLRSLRKEQYDLMRARADARLTANAAMRAGVDTPEVRAWL